jgi:hypothetical protein
MTKPTKPPKPTPTPSLADRIYATGRTAPTGQWATITVRLPWETHLAVRRHVLDMRAAGVKTSIAETVNHALLFYMSAHPLR